MPIYEYVCSDCNLKFELLRPLSEASQKASCPQCHKSADRVMSACTCFTRDATGLTTAVSGGGSSSCAGCGSSSCGSCGI